MMVTRRLLAILSLLISSSASAAEPAAETGQRGDDPTAGNSQQTAAPPVPSEQSTPVPASASRERPAAAARGGTDRLELDTTVVTGNRELPKVLYIVPWKKADLGELPAQPFNTLLDEVLTPVDRDVFRREVTYYGVVSSGAGATAAAGAAPPGEAGRTEK